jgi:hypothetical protein
MSSRANLFLVLVIVFAVVARLVPAIAFDNPFSTDVWPLIRLTRVVVEDPSARIWNDTLFDGYNNRWPGVILSASIACAITGISVEHVYSFLYTVAITVASVALLYCILSYASNRKAALAAVLYYVAAPSLLIFTSTTLKEVYAYPILFSIVLQLVKREFDWRYIATVTILSLALSTSHHLASVMLIGMSISILTASTISAIVGELRAVERGALAKQLALVLIALPIFTLYYLLYGQTRVVSVISFSDLLSYALYAVFIYTSYYLAKQVSVKRAISISAVLTALTATAFVSLHSLVYGVTYSLDDIAIHIVAVSAPLVLLCFLPSAVDKVRLFVLGIALFMSVNLLFIYIAKPELVTALHRVLNYLPIMNSMLIAYTYRGRVAKCIALALVLMTTACGVVAVVRIVLGLDKTMFYWAYRGGDVVGMSRIEALFNGSVLGDSKVFYFMYKRVDSSSLLVAVSRGFKGCGNAVVVLHRDNYDKGFVASLTIQRVSNVSSVVNKLSKVYDNMYITGFWVRQ